MAIMLHGFTRKGKEGRKNKSTDNPYPPIEFDGESIRAGAPLLSCERNYERDIGMNVLEAHPRLISIPEVNN